MEEGRIHFRGLLRVSLPSLLLFPNEVFFFLIFAREFLRNAVAFFVSDIREKEEARLCLAGARIHYYTSRTL